MKKLLSVLLSVIFALSFVNCFAFAADSAGVSKTEAFLDEMISDGVEVKGKVKIDTVIKADINCKVSIKGENAAVKANWGILTAKAVLKDNELKASLGLIGLNVSSILGQEEVNEITKALRETVPEAINAIKSNLLKYLKVEDFKKDGDGKYVESFVLNYDAVADYIVEKYPEAADERTSSDVAVFCGKYAETDEEIKEILDITGLKTVFKDNGATKLIGIMVSEKNEDGTESTVDFFNELLAQETGGSVDLKIDYIVTGVKNSAFSKPFSIFNLTRLIEKIINFL